MQDEMFDFEQDSQGGFNPVEHRRNTDPVTSHLAAMSAGELAKHHAQIIYNALQSVYPESLNYEEIAQRVGFDNPNKVARRMVDLERKNKVERTGKARNTKAGRLATLWRAI